MTKNPSRVESKSAYTAYMYALSAAQWLDEPVPMYLLYRKYRNERFVRPSWTHIHL